MHNEAWTAHGADLDCKNFARADEGDCFDLRPLPGGNRAYDPAVRKALAGSSVCLSRPLSEAPRGAGNWAGDVQKPAGIRGTRLQISAGPDDEGGVLLCPDD